jgi:ankyrin repeat protein
MMATPALPKEDEEKKLSKVTRNKAIFASPSQSPTYFRDIVAGLVQAGAHVDGLDYKGDTPLMRILRVDPRIIGYEIYDAIVEDLIKAGANVNARSRDGSSILHLASEHEYSSPNAIHMLEAAGAVPNP